MENYYFNRVDMSEWFPGATAKLLQALDNDTNDLLAEISVTPVEFWSLPGDTFEEDELEDEEIFERVLDSYSERMGD